MPRYYVERTVTLVVNAPNKEIAMKAARESDGEEHYDNWLYEFRFSVKPMKRVKLKFKEKT